MLFLHSNFEASSPGIGDILGSSIEISSHAYLRKRTSHVHNQGRHRDGRYAIPTLR